MTSLKQTLDNLAKVLSDKVAKDDTSLQESIDAFRALTAYYAAQGKRVRKQDDDEPDSDGFTFAGSDEVVNGSNSRDQKIRTRRNS